MKLFIAVLVAAFAVTVGAQTANVIELTPADQARAQKAWDALQKAQGEWNALKPMIEDKYLHVGRDDPMFKGGQTNTCFLNENYCERPGFMGGFEFSKDFRFIVPKAPEVKPAFSPFILNGVGNLDCATQQCARSYEP